MGTLLTSLWGWIQAVLLAGLACGMVPALALAFDAWARRRAHRALREKLLAEFPDLTGIWWTPDVRARMEEIKARVAARYQVEIGDFEMIWPSGASMKITCPKDPLEQKARELCQRLSRWLSSSRFSPTAPNSGAAPSGRELPSS